MSTFLNRRRTLDVVTTALAVLVASMGFVVLDQRPAHAVACEKIPGRNAFDGFWHNVSTYPQYNWEGASAFIVVRWPLTTCTGGFRPFTYAYSMIASGDGGPGDGWGQIGFMRYTTPGGDVVLQHVAQFANDFDGNHNGIAGDVASELKTYYVGTPGTGDKVAYRVLWNAGCICLQASVNGVVYASSTFNPFNPGTAGWHQPFSPQFMGETTYRTGNMPGTASQPTAFSALGAQRYSDDALVSMSCSMTGANDNPTLWGRSSSTCTAFNIWQK